MATEKILIFDEQGNAKRMKVRIARFLDNEPVTASDKTNIRTTLDVDDSLSGTFTTPLSVTSASDSSFTGGGDLNVSGGKTTLTNDSDNALVVETTNKNPMYVNVVGSAPNYLFDVRDDDTSKFRVDGSGRVGIGTSSPGTAAAAADDLVIVTNGGTGVSIRSSSADSGAIYFADGTSGDERYRGIVRYNHGADQLELWSTSAHRWSVNASGNLAPASSGLGIDFGSGASTTLNAYEEGTFTSTFRDATSGGNASPTMTGVYTRIGDVVYFRVGTGNINTSGMTAGNAIYLHGLPFQAAASKSGPVSAVLIDTVVSGNYLTVGVQPGTSYCYFTKNTSGGADAPLLVSNLTSGVSNMAIGGWYYA